MKRIVIHWTAGASYPCETDIESYHFLVDKDGKIYEGKYKPEDNENCSDGVYAKHTGGGNTGSIGIAMCGMSGFKSRGNPGKFLITKLQCQKTIELIAKLCKKYSIPVTDATIFTHYEFGLKNQKSSSSGKIDIIFLPLFPELFPYEIGDFMRDKIETERKKIV